MGADEYFDLIKDINPIVLSYMGRGYVIDYCVSALKKKREDFLYRVYITDALKAIADNTAQYVGASGLVKAGTILNKRYAEIVIENDNKAKRLEKEEVKTSEEVIETIKRKLKKLGSGHAKGEK